MQTPKRLFAICVSLSFAVGCGGSQTTQPEPEQPVAQVEPTPVPAEEPPPPEPVVEHVYYQVYWNGIHVLTIYRGAGTIRSEEPDHPDNVMPERSDYMSAISHYFEHEPELAALFEQADDLDELLELLVETGHEIEEVELDEGY